MPDRLGDKARLHHILNAITEIGIYLNEIDFDTFIQDSMRYNATLRQLEIIGEASGHLSTEIKGDFEEIPWASIRGLRNLVVHEYFGIDDRTIWTIVSEEIPELKIAILEMLKRVSLNKEE